MLLFAMIETSTLNILRVQFIDRDGAGDGDDQGIYGGRDIKQQKTGQI